MFGQSLFLPFSKVKLCVGLSKQRFPLEAYESRAIESRLSDGMHSGRGMFFSFEVEASKTLPLIGI